MDIETIGPNENPAVDLINVELRNIIARNTSLIADAESGAVLSKATMDRWCDEAERAAWLIGERARITGEPLGPDHAEIERSLDVLRRLRAWD